ncbi:MAG: hypothetical protein K0Q72_587 [Armatimonadetes bacterium]|jgi:hypothetical protein|nr:hypothetical protein [Armatimonadota bacterium]
MEGQALFEETQEPPWPLAVLAPGATAAGVMAAARVISLGARFGVAGLAAAATGMALREVYFPMETVLRSEEIQVRFGRRTRFRIPLKNVTRAYARTYSPINEFGGWGIRTGKQGRAFNMRGNQGVQLVLRSGQRVLIGSQQSDELAWAIQKATGCETTPDAAV